jgi:hypothetical protein
MIMEMGIRKAIKESFCSRLRKSFERIDFMIVPIGFGKKKYLSN